MYKELINKCEKEVEKEFEKINKILEHNTKKVIESFWNHRVDDTLFNTSTGYGYGDKGRDIIENIFADILGYEDALVRIQFISGTHAISTALFAILRPGDTMLSICGKPYDTLDEVIGIRENPSSLKSFNVEYEQIDLMDNGKFDEEKILDKIKSKKIKLIEIQRSRGYSLRESLTIEKIEQVIKFIKSINKEIIIVITKNKLPRESK